MTDQSLEAPKSIDLILAELAEGLIEAEAANSAIAALSAEAVESALKARDITLHKPVMGTSNRGTVTARNLENAVKVIKAGVNRRRSYGVAPTYSIEREATYGALKSKAVCKNCLVVDAEDASMSRLAAFIADHLRGKHRAEYTSHVNCGDYVVVINADKVKASDMKIRKRGYRWHDTPATGDKVGRTRSSERDLEKAIERMFPKENPGAREQLSHLKIYGGASRPPEVKGQEIIAFKGLSASEL